MVDKTVILRKLAELEEYLGRLKNMPILLQTDIRRIGKPKGLSKEHYR